MNLGPDSVERPPADCGGNPTPFPLPNTTVASGGSVEGNLCFQAPYFPFTVVPPLPPLVETRWGNSLEPHLTGYDQSSLSTQAPPYLPASG